MNDSHFAMVSEWMVNGNINQFVRKHKDVNRFEPVGSQFYCRSRSLTVIPYSHSSKTSLGV